MSYKIFDAHVHVCPDAIAKKARYAFEKFYNFYVPCVATFDAYIDEYRKNNTNGFLMFSVATSAYQVKSINDYITARVADAHALGYETVGFAAMHQDFVEVEDELDDRLNFDEATKQAILYNHAGRLFFHD